MVEARKFTHRRVAIARPCLFSLLSLRANVGFLQGTIDAESHTRFGLSPRLSQRLGDSPVTRNRPLKTNDLLVHISCRLPQLTQAVVWAGCSAVKVFLVGS